LFIAQEENYFTVVLSRQKIALLLFFLKDASFSRRRIFSRVGIVFFLFFFCVRFVSKMDQVCERISKRGITVYILENNRARDSTFMSSRVLLNS